MVSENNGIYKLIKEGYKYRDIISWGFFSEEVQKRDKEFYSEIAKNKQNLKGGSYGEISNIGLWWSIHKSY